MPSFASLQNLPVYSFLHGPHPMMHLLVYTLITLALIFGTLWAIVKVRGVGNDVFIDSAATMGMAIPAAVIPPAFLVLMLWAFGIAMFRK